jgi:hypothetical protein
MKILSVALMLALVLPPAASAGEHVILWNLQIIYARGAGIKTFADEREKYEKKRNRLGTGLLVLGDVPAVAPLPHPRRRR